MQIKTNKMCYIYGVKNHITVFKNILMFSWLIFYVLLCKVKIILMLLNK